MARGGGGRGRKVTVSTGKWQTVSKTRTSSDSDSDDEEIAKKMTDADWQHYFEYMADYQVLCVKRVHNSILEEVMNTYCPETSDSYEKILEETHEWIKSHR